MWIIYRYGGIRKQFISSHDSAVKAEQCLNRLPDNQGYWLTFVSIQSLEPSLV